MSSTQSSILYATESDTRTKRVLTEENYSSKSIRSGFQRDRDRIIACKAFRRLDGKTQVFYADIHDHIRNRLTHSIEVKSIADSIGKRLNLNRELIESISLSHDIGHAPFGHTGERTLNLIMNGCEDILGVNANIPTSMKGFKHNWQSYRISTSLSSYSRKFMGLNLSPYTLWGIVNHTKRNWSICKKPHLCHCDMFINKVCEKKLMIGFYLKDDLNFSQEYDWSFEAIAVAVADEIAQRYQDIVDSVAYKIIDLQSIVDVFMSYFSYFLTRQQKKEIQIIHKEKDPGYGCIKFSRVMIDMYIEHFCDTINKKTKFMRGSNSFNPTDFIKYKYSEPNLYRKYNDFEASFKNSNDGFQEYLRDMIIKSHLVQMSDGRASYMIRKIFESLISNPMQLSDRALLMFLLNVNPIGYKKGIISGELDPHMDNNEVSKGARSKLKEKYLFPDNEWKHDPTKYHILLRTICDFISGMTDHYAASYYQKLYGIRSLYNIN